MEFNNLSTVEFQKSMAPHVIDIYKRVFPGCRVEYFTGGHTLDIEFGIDGLIHIGDQWISVQEKFRENSTLKYCDFTQEYKNAGGAENGEFFHLGAQIYFYGWANKSMTGFEKWFIMDIAIYKIIVNSLGGLDKIGTMQKNKKHGSAIFYGIPIKTLSPAFIADYRNETPKISAYDDIEYFSERAAILEYDAGYTRENAEIEARKMMVERRLRLNHSGLQAALP